MRGLLMRYVSVVNNTNKIATVHILTCGTLKQGQEAMGKNAVRRDFEDGVAALEFACAEMPSNYGFCALCLKSVKAVASGAR